MDSAEKYRRRIGFWRSIAVAFGIAFLGVLIALIVIVVNYNSNNTTSNGASADSQTAAAGGADGSIPCPPKTGGLQTSGDPSRPSPFHDLTSEEQRRVYSFLMKQAKLNLADPQKARLNTSNIFMMDLLLPPKQSVLAYLDRRGQQPAREARVMIFRGDSQPPVVEEYRVGPMSNPSYVELIVNPKYRNPVPFALRPYGDLEITAIFDDLLPRIDQAVGPILEESYGGRFSDCGDHCLTFFLNGVGTAVLGSPNRTVWLWTVYPAPEYYTLYPVDFGVLLHLDASDPQQWSLGKAWYAGRLYDSLSHLAASYVSSNKTRVPYTINNESLNSAQKLRGVPVPETPQRPPVQREPDGKRYTIHHRHVKYLHWDFDIRMSAFRGPQVYDVRYQGERLLYELGLSEIAVYYSGNAPMQRLTNYVDSGLLIGTHSKSLIPGVDCPETATFLSASFLGEGMEEATRLAHSMCVFEQDTGVPLRRHMSYAKIEGGFYGGMPDVVLIFRCILTIVNYDYIVDFVFHQTGVIETRVMSTGYILTTFYRPEEAPYGFRLHDHINANIHHHMFHFKADLDIGGTVNRYETLDMSEEEVVLTQMGPSARFRQTRFQRNLRNTEREAVYKFNFDTPKYHLVYNNKSTTQYGVHRAYRLHMAGMSKQLLSEGSGNEPSVSWARQQMAVTQRRDEEQGSSSPYAMVDSLQPVVDFSSFIGDDSIVDQDLVFWITMGTHHIPHTEDLPVTSTAGGHMAFFLLPYNYFPHCPSLSSRDNVRVEYAEPYEASEGLRVDRNGNKVNEECGRATLEQLVKERPDDFLQTHREFKLL